MRAEVAITQPFEGLCGEGGPASEGKDMLEHIAQTRTSVTRLNLLKPLIISS
jgi:hypothetical protein